MQTSQRGYMIDNNEQLQQDEQDREAARYILNHHLVKDFIDGERTRVMDCLTNVHLDDIETIKDMIVMLKGVNRFETALQQHLLPSNLRG